MWRAWCMSGRRCLRSRNHCGLMLVSPASRVMKGPTYLGQQPTAVSPAVNRNCNGHPDVPPAVAEHAVAYPAGHSIPGEYTPQPRSGDGAGGAPLDVGGQQVVASAGCPALHVWPRKAKLPAESPPKRPPNPRRPPFDTWPTATVHDGGGVKTVVRGPRMVGAWPTIAVADMLREIWSVKESDCV